MEIIKYQLRARQCLYWSCINNGIVEYVNNCDTCLNYRNSNQTEFWDSGRVRVQILKKLEYIPGIIFKLNEISL